MLNKTAEGLQNDDNQPVDCSDVVHVDVQQSLLMQPPSLGDFILQT